jgi:hypothetical protein
VDIAGSHRSPPALRHLQGQEAKASQPRKARKRETVEAKKARMCGFCCTVPVVRGGGRSTDLLLSFTGRGQSGANGHVHRLWQTKAKFLQPLCARPTGTHGSVVDEDLGLAPFTANRLDACCHCSPFSKAPTAASQATALGTTPDCRITSKRPKAGHRCSPYAQALTAAL